MEEEKKTEIIVRFPGERIHSSNAPYNFRNSVDPRLGKAQRLIDSGFFPDVYNEDRDEGEVVYIGPPEKKRKRKLKGEYKTVKVRKIMIVYDENGAAVNVERTEERKLNDGKKPIRKTVVMTKTIPAPVDPTSESFKKSSTSIFKIDREKFNRPLSMDPPLTPMERLRKSLDDMTKNEKQIYRDRDIGCATAAVQFYNQKHGTDYEVVETLGSYQVVFNGLLLHCNFRAQSKSGSRPSPKLFFAELLNNLDAASVKQCAILGNPGTLQMRWRGNRALACNQNCYVDSKGDDDLTLRCERGKYKTRGDYVVLYDAKKF